MQCVTCSKLKIIFQSVRCAVREPPCYRETPGVGWLPGQRTWWCQTELQLPNKVKWTLPIFVLGYCKTQNICLTLFSPTREELRFRPVLNPASYNIDYTFYMRMFIFPCLEFAQLGEIKTRLNKTLSTVYKIHKSG